ncbi:MAG: TetR/AcrR family transcriptional regulator [Myxococcaceae bacterium]
MARTRGSRNAGYDEERQRLARKAAEALQREPGPNASLRDIAEHAGTSVATLRHYFVDREGLLKAVMESLRTDAAPYLARASEPIIGDVRASLLRFVGGLNMAWSRYGVGKMYASSLAVGLGNKPLGPSFVLHVLEPLLQTGEALLRQHEDRRELVVGDTRHAALMLLSPVVLGLLHQDSLQGAQCRPLDVPVMLETHVDAFLRAFGPGRARPR